MSKTWNTATFDSIADDFMNEFSAEEISTAENPNMELDSFLCDHEAKGQIPTPLLKRVIDELVARDYQGLDIKWFE